MPDAIKSRATPWATIILLCGKCARKMDGGYGDKGKDSLRTALRTELKETGHGRETRILETRCMGLCPKKAVAALNASNPEQILTIPKRTAADEALAQLIPESRLLVEKQLTGRFRQTPLQIPEPE